MHALRRPQGHGLSCDVRFESKHGVTGVSPGMTVPTGRSVPGPGDIVTQSNTLWPSLCNITLCIMRKTKYVRKEITTPTGFLVLGNSCTEGVQHTQKKANIQAQDTHIPAVVSPKRKQQRVLTQRSAFRGVGGGRWALERCSHVAVAPVSLGHRSMVSDHLFSFLPCLF